MIKTLIVFLIIFAGIIVGPSLIAGSGFAMFQVSGYRIKMNLGTFIVFDLLFLFLLIFVYTLGNNLFGKYNIFYHLYSLFSKYHHCAEKAQIAFLEGDYKKAIGLFKKSATKTKNHTLSYLQVAQAAVNNFDTESAKTALSAAALTCTSREKLAFEVIQLRLLIKANKWSQASQRADLLLNKYSKQPEALRLAYEIYSKEEEYQKIIDRLPLMCKARIYPKILLEHYVADTYLHRIQQLADASDVQALKRWWDNQPRKIRTDPIYQREAARQFNRLGQYAEADKLRHILLKQQEQQ